jgi:MarR family protein
MKQERKKQERRIVQIDLNTGKVLKGYLIWKGVKYSPYYGGWYMQRQQVLVSLAQDKEITGECYRVLFILLAEVDYENFIYIPQTEIARKLNMHPQSVHRAIKLLVQKGVLLRSERGFRLNANYGWKGKVRHKDKVRHPEFAKSP